MNVVVDTSVWSEAYRRRTRRTFPIAVELAELIREGRALILGPVRQELLSGVKEELRFLRLRNVMRAFSDLQLETEDYETAAEFYNRCRTRGISGSHTDLLICAVSARRRCLVFTTDKDFSRYGSVLPIRLHQPRA